MERWKENWHEKILVAIICVSVGIFLIDYAFGRQGVMLFAKMLSCILFLIPIAAIYWFIEHCKFGKLKNLTEIDLLQAEVKKRHYLAEHTVHELSGGAVFHVNHLRGNGNYHSKTRSRVLDADTYDDSDALGVIETEMPESRERLLDVIGQSQQIWMVGGMGAGKTSLLAHLSDMFESYGETQYIIDPNMEPDKWSASNRIKILVGGGNDYGEVYKAMIHIISLINKRLIALRNGQRGQGNFKKQIIRIVVDEWTLVPSSLKMLKDKAALMNFMQMMGIDGSSQGASMDKISPKIVLNYFLDFLCTQGRKVGVFFCFATHSETTRSTGFDERHDLYEQINHKVHIRLVGNDRYANVQFGSMPKNEEMKYELPGQHQRMVELENREYTGHNDPVMSHSHSYKQPFNAQYKPSKAHHDRHDEYDAYDYPKIGHDTEMGGEAVFDEKIIFFESKAQKTAYDMDKQGHSLNNIAKAIFGYVNGQKAAKIKKWLSEI